MRKQILLPPSVFRELYQTFKVHRVILSRALKYERNSKRDQMLRAAALERGGLIYTGERAPQGYCPNVETRHDHVRGNDVSKLRRSSGVAGEPGDQRRDDHHRPRACGDIQ